MEVAELTRTTEPVEMREPDESLMMPRSAPVEASWLSDSGDKRRIALQRKKATTRDCEQDEERDMGHHLGMEW